MTDSHVNYPLTKLAGVHEPCFHSGAKFRGIQGSRFWGNLDVKIELLNVDRENDYLCGFITVIDMNCTDDPDSLERTYFEGEIISKKYPFPTRKWSADAEVDKKYWWKFGCFCKYLLAFSKNADKFDYAQLRKEECIYMRWKEHRGAGSEQAIVSPGFHYICLNKRTGILESAYYERFRSEWCELTFLATYVPERSTAVYQFR